MARSSVAVPAEAGVVALSTESRNLAAEAARESIQKMAQRWGLPEHTSYSRRSIRCCAAVRGRRSPRRWTLSGVRRRW